MFSKQHYKNIEKVKAKVLNKVSDHNILMWSGGTGFLNKSILSSWQVIIRNFIKKIKEILSLVRSHILLWKSLSIGHHSQLQIPINIDQSIPNMKVEI